MQISSPAFNSGGKIPSKYTCDGQNINPPIEFSDISPEAETLALIVDDPDAVKPTGQVWDHWIVFNIPPSVKKIPEDEEPEGLQGEGTDEKRGYQGPCPPDGEHTYYFKAYCLDTKLNLPAGVSKEKVEEAMEGHILAKAVLRGRYDREK
ncbi:MAG: YbhB/YbcL family Raf kinase inhibitor-like protein [Candidatus Magasanikbacteria bacterium]